MAKEEDSEEKITKVCRARQLIGNDTFNYNTAPVCDVFSYLIVKMK